MALNFAQQRKAAAKKASQLGALSDGPSLPRGYGMVPTQYKGENGGTTLDILDSGGPNGKGTIVNAPNAAYSKLEPVDPTDASLKALKYKKTGH